MAAGYYRLTGDIQRSQLSDVVGAASFPRLLAATLAVLSAILVVTGFVKQVSAAKAAGTAPSEGAPQVAEAAAAAAETRRVFLRAGGTVLIGVGFLLAAPWLGYAPAIALLIGAMLLYNRVAWNWKLALVAAMAGVFFWVLFGFVFSVPLPRGVWPRWLGL